MEHITYIGEVVEKFMKNLVKTGMNFWKVIHLEKKLSLYIRL
jgi:hypothetical protein